MKTLELQLINSDWLDEERARLRKTAGILSSQLLKNQNDLYNGTLGVSRNNRDAGFVPGYFDRHSGRTAMSRFADGRPAPVHVLDGLPDEWIAERDACGRVTKARAGVVAGFLRNGRFYTREEAARAASH
jgi:hypothetical protein